MLEQQMEDLIAAYPREFFPQKNLVLKGRQGFFAGVGRYDLLFEDERHTSVLMELKAVPAKYEHADQLGRYQTALEDRGEGNVLLWLVAPVIPQSVRNLLDRVGIEYTEIHEAQYRDVARRHGVALDGAPEKRVDVAHGMPTPVTVGSDRLNQTPPLPRAAAPSRSSRAPGRQTQLAIVDAILGAYPYSDGKWLTAERQVELLHQAQAAKLPDGRSAFAAMQAWDGENRTNRMRYHHVKLVVSARNNETYASAVRSGVHEKSSGY
jgi:hypothetical protein